MGHRTEPHTWGRPYEHDGSSYRECTIEDCGCHQEWICALDRWSDAFETPSPRQRSDRAEQEQDGSTARSS